MNHDLLPRMSSKRGASSTNLVSDGLSASHSVPRSASPLGLGSLFQKPKWFGRAGVSRSNHSPTETRSSFQKGTKISGPTNPRPLPAQDQLKPSSRSVLSLSMNRSTSQLAVSIPPSSSASARSDLRATAGKKWSRSVDDLSKFSTLSPESPPSPSPVTDQRMRIDEYRARVAPSSAGPGTVTFPTPSSIAEEPIPPNKRHGRSMSFGRHKEPIVPRSNEPVPALPSRIPVRSPASQHLGTLNSPSARPSFERSHSSEKEKTPSGGSVATGAGYSVRAFGFPFGMNKPSAQPAPPQIVLSTAPDMSLPLTPTTPTTASMRKALKRASQTVMYKGFLLKLDHPSQPLAQGKPYKAVLVGSKLQFYKPPGGSSGELRQMFPDGIMQPDIEEVVEEEDAGPSSRPPVRRRFWGRTRHPELVVPESKDGIQGSLDALVHEVVFGTTFSGDERIKKEAFAKAVLFCLPSAVPQRTDFSESFMRYLGSGVQSAEDDKEWIEWCVRTYAAIYGLDGEWDDWMAKNGIHLETASGIGSPFIGVFSPRPEQASAFGSAVPHPPTNPTKSIKALKATPGVAIPVTALTPDTISEFFSRSSKLGLTLERDRLSRDVFLRIPSATIAKSLRLLNQSFLVLAANDQDSLQPSRFLRLPRGTEPASLFCGSDDAPHWLTRLVMTQVLSPDMVGHELPASDTAASMNLGSGIIPEGVKVSRTHTRAAVLCKWIRLGELARVNGDECTWRAIQAAVCARAIARLERVFRRMSDDEREIVSAWAREDVARGLGAGRCTPWEGDVRERIGREMERARTRNGAWRVKPFENVGSMMGEVESAWGACVSGSLPLNDTDVEDVVGLVRYFKRHAEDAELVKSKHIGDYNALSFAIEPRRNRHYAPHFFRNKPTQSSHPLAPLLFPELMPTITMLDRTGIIRGRKVSSHEVAGPVEMSQEHINAVVTRTRAFQSEEQTGQKGKGQQDVRLLGEDFGETTLTVFGGELVLKLMKEEEKRPGGERSQISTSRSTTMLRNVSRPASVVEEEDGVLMSASGIWMNGSGVLITPNKLERKPSRTPSIRATPSSHLERKQSVLRSRRSSLPSISQRTSLVVTETSEEPPLRALVSSGSLEKLVDVLVSGLEEVGMQTSPADDNGETSLREGRTRGIRVDHSEYCKVFWGVFRSFVTPVVLFEMIQKRYKNADDRKSFSHHASNFVRFSSHANDEGAKTDEDSAQYKSEVLQTLTNWIVEGGGGQDLLDDTDFFDGMHRFLFHSDAPDLAPLKDLFKRVTRRPSLEVVPGPSAGQTSTGFGSAAPSLCDIDPETLADNLDAIAAAAFKPVTLTDLIVALDLLETQSADRLGWYVVSDLPATAEDLSIQNIYTQLQEVDTAGLISEMGPEKFVRNLPSSIRSVFRAHDIVRRWAIMNIVTPRLGVQVRQERIELFLQTIEVCRLRTADLPNIQGLHQPSIRTFTETALGAALCSPESRLFTRAWQDVGAARGASIESLSSLLATPRVESIRSSRRMTADMGWLIECMLELLSLPDKSSEGGSGVELINFDKRRYLFNLISNAPNLQPLRRQQLRSNTNRADVDRMTSMQREIADSFYEQRVLREEAHKENTQSSPIHSQPRKLTRPFHRTVLEQLEKNKRDRYARERLQKEIKAERLISERRDDNITKAMFPKGQHGQRKKSRSMSGFFTMLRPISAAWSSDKIQLKPRTLEELDFEPTGKPSWVLSLANSQVQDFVNKQRSFLMRLRTEDGGLYYLQALEQQDATKWLTVLQETSTNYARRRLTYQGKAEPTEAGAPSWNPNTKHPNPVYGVPLLELLERENGSPPPADAIPRIVKTCIQEVESRGLTESGIYRLVPSSTDLAQLRDMFDSGAAFVGPLDPFMDIMAFTSALKAWFRSLPESVFTNALYQSFMEAMRDTNFDSKYTRLRELIHMLPPNNFQLIRAVFEHLDRVTDFEEQNQMTADNLATCFSQSLILPPGSTNGFPINMGEHHNLVKSLIVQYHWIFEEAEADHEEDEDEIDEEAVASDSEDLEGPEVTGVNLSRLNMSEDDVFVNEPNDISHANRSRTAAS